MAEGPDAAATDTITLRAGFRRLLLRWILALLGLACAVWLLDEAPILTAWLGGSPFEMPIAVTAVVLAGLLAAIFVWSDDPIVVLGPDSMQINNRLGKRTIPYHAIAFIKRIPIGGVGIKLKTPNDLLKCVDTSSENARKIVALTVRNMSAFRCEFVILACKFTLVDGNTHVGRSALLSLLRKKAGLTEGCLMPESKFVVEVRDTEIVNHRPDGTIQHVAPANLRAVIIETSNCSRRYRLPGPFGADIWWILAGDSGENSCSFPGGATGEEAVLAFLQKLPGFDNEKFIEAMQSTHNARFVCWQARPENDDGVSPTATTQPDSTTTL